MNTSKIALTEKLLRVSGHFYDEEKQRWYRTGSGLTVKGHGFTTGTGPVWNVSLCDLPVCVVSDLGHYVRLVDAIEGDVLLIKLPEEPYDYKPIPESLTKFIAREIKMDRLPEPKVGVSADEFQAWEDGCKEGYSHGFIQAYRLLKQWNACHLKVPSVE